MDQETSIPFIAASSIVRKIWGTTDVTLFIFAGAAAEFALSKEVDWLYFTGKLPANPIGRLFSTVRYAQQIIFSEPSTAAASINRINDIHQGVQSQRGQTISSAAFRHVLYMLIHYSIAAFELLERPLSMEEKDDVVQVFRQVGERMRMADLHSDYRSWRADHAILLPVILAKSNYTKDLFHQYRKHLGPVRYWLLLQVQSLLVPALVRRLLGFRQAGTGKQMIAIYRTVRNLAVSRKLVVWLVPARFRAQLASMQRA